MLAEVLAPLQIPLWIDLTAVVIGALAGATVAVREHQQPAGLGGATGPWNAAAALLGAVAHVAANNLDAATVVCEVLAFSLVVLVRLLSVWRGWETPVPIDLTPAITRPLRGARPPTRRRRER